MARPDELLIVAIDVLLVVHTPPGVVLEYVVVAETHKEDAPVMGFTVGGVQLFLKAINILVCLKLADAVAVPLPVAPALVFMAEAAPTPLSFPFVVLASTNSVKDPGLVVVHPEMVLEAPCEVAVNMITRAFAVVVVMEAPLMAVPVTPVLNVPVTSIGVVPSTPE